MKVKIINKSKFPNPNYQHPGDAGIDLRWDAPDTRALVLGPLEREVLNTGIFMEIPEGFECQIRPRSGLAAKRGITVLNTPGTIDSNYRGEIQVILVNLSLEKVSISGGERIAQMVFSKVENVIWIPVTEFSETSRGEGGFGSTGTK
jgi:dUTP pyrophosphatase